MRATRLYRRHGRKARELRQAVAAVAFIAVPKRAHKPTNSLRQAGDQWTVFRKNLARSDVGMVTPRGVPRPRASLGEKYRVSMHRPNSAGMHPIHLL